MSVPQTSPLPALQRGVFLCEIGLMMSLMPRRGVAALILAGSCALLLAIVPACGADAMPKDFVYLADIDPTIQQDMRYASANNFIGKIVPGYVAPECVLVRQAAEALKRVEADVRAKGFTLKVYDCYRPGARRCRLRALGEGA